MVNSQFFMYISQWTWKTYIRCSSNIRCLSNITGKHLCWSLFLIKLVISCESCEILCEKKFLRKHLFWRTPPTSFVQDIIWTFYVQLRCVFTGKGYLILNQNKLLFLYKFFRSYWNSRTSLSVALLSKIVFYWNNCYFFVIQRNYK